MTLITFQSRIHFATDVLEEALRAELEESEHRRVLVIHDQKQPDAQLLERVYISLPDNVSREVVAIAPDHSKVVTGELGLVHETNERVDVIIALGSARAIGHARKCRQLFAQSRMASLPQEERRTQRTQAYLPDFFAIPGVDGMPDPCLSGGATASFKTSPPNVIICDPSVIAKSTETDIANAFAKTLGRCLGTFAGSNFNPLADGMAAEGLRRLAMILPQVYENQTAHPLMRDLMAASLIGSISQQKGPGLVEAIANALTLLTQNDVDTGSLQRILMPRLLHDLQLISRHDEALILRLLDAEDDASLSRSIEEILDPLPLNRSLRDMGLALSDVQKAITAAQDRIHMPGPVAKQIQTIVEDVF
ncbi:iron-containing alcohol dehydrogenase [Yoonia sp. BS5-3]|uniref:Iron-containing alcohol dehydrogenase n=1 Tax=Yoonia phaeophyticola TaxID=3137369 RepID=A0ABZ2V4U1_9RHOB